ncbi:hypothetical protein [Streptomyces sp. NBC_00237]|uniref:hypothetical protein n=1 Tax=Streptomyces sp. NBC_00237 TaxID=2975687 RepID=UPI002B1E197C|nr:hypothetical protein [Streptomyces sp. NBC_00237]
MIGLSAVVVFTVLLPFAGASAGPAGSPAEPEKGHAAPVTDDPKAQEDAAEGPGRTRARCGPEVSSPDGVEAQTCVLTEKGETWARTYYRNATGEELDAVLTLMGPAGRTVRMRCEVGAGDEPGSCETPREGVPKRTVAEAGGEAGAGTYTAVSEFASPGDGPLLLRSGSNSPESAGP